MTDQNVCYQPMNLLDSHGTELVLIPDETIHQYLHLIMDV